MSKVKDVHTHLDESLNEIDRLRAELAALRAELVSIPDELADRFHCFAHAHNHRWHEALCSAVFQLERAEKAEAERESAHAAQRHAETELSQFMAWYAMAEHQHLHEQARAERAEAELAALRAEKVSQCGHPSSLMLRSAETGKALYCELCDERKRRRDAESMEEHYKARAEKAKAERDALRKTIDAAPHEKTCRSRGCGKCFSGSAFSDHVGDCEPGTGPCNCWKRAALGER